jgi:hypothetical protein
MSKLKVVNFKRERTDEFAPKILLTEAAELDLETVIILGTGPNGDYVSSSTLDIGLMLRLIEMFKFELLAGSLGDVE